MPSPVQRILQRATAEPGPLATPCWRTSYSLTRDGYVAVSDHGKKLRAHRVTYEHFVGSIPAGLDLDHLCRNRWCVSPWHVEPTTRKENLHRGEGAAIAAIHRGTCVKGLHPWTPGRCRPCLSIYNRNAYQARKRKFDV